MLFILKIKFYLRRNLSRYRYWHSVRVALECKKLAKYYNINVKDAYLAGLLHDIAKEYDYDKVKCFINKYNIASDDDNVIHGKIGALVARELYNINDDVYSAILYHTIGNECMNMLDKVVFIADKIEKKKDYPGVDILRKLAYVDIDKCLISYFEKSDLYLKSLGKKLHGDSVKLLIRIEDSFKE